MTAVRRNAAASDAAATSNAIPERVGWNTRGPPPDQRGPPCSAHHPLNARAGHLTPARQTRRPQRARGRCPHYESHGGAARYGRSPERRPSGGPTSRARRTDKRRGRVVGAQHTNQPWYRRQARSPPPEPSHTLRAAGPPTGAGRRTDRPAHTTMSTTRPGDFDSEGQYDDAEANGETVDLYDDGILAHQIRYDKLLVGGGLPDEAVEVKHTVDLLVGRSDQIDVCVRHDDGDTVVWIAP